VREILDEAATSPKVALMALSAELERELRRLSAVTGWARNQRTARGILRELPVAIPEDLRGVIDEFWVVRNRVVHGAPASDDDALRTLDAGLAILKAVQQIPAERHFVADPNVTVYSDAELNTKRPDVHGVQLRSVSSDGDSERLQIYPTTRTHFQLGEQVAWDWDARQRWGRSWYRDPSTGDAKIAWDDALEFVGRLLRDI